MDRRKVAYIYHGEYIKESDEFIPTTNRNSMVHSLISSYGLLAHLWGVAPKQASIDDLANFHCRQYLTYIAEHTESDEEIDEEDTFGVGYDCPLTPGVITYCQRIGGGSITAAELLCKKACSIAIHWLGGWHHAQRAEASGFCYVNDCVLAILKLRETFNRVMYIDIDVHHGDGVEDAFLATPKVLTFSVHKYEAGFFPGTGHSNDKGIGKGKGYAVNLPLKEGMQDEAFVANVKLVLAALKSKFKPDAIVCQFGADGLSGDPMASFNLTDVSFTSLIKFIKDWDLPMLVLGGGGYNEANVARCWTAVTAAILHKTLPNEIPEENPYFLKYSPLFELSVEKTYRRDMNTPTYLSSTVKSLMQQIDDMKEN